jgi:hypothetical protein
VLNKLKLQGYRDAQQNCQRCGSKTHEKGVECSEETKACRFCGCIGHIRAMCPTYSAKGLLRKADKQVEEEDDRTEKATDRKRERSVSAIDDKPLKPQRKEHDANVPGSSEKTQNRATYDSSRFQGKEHRSLPIRSTDELGSPVEQHQKWLNDDPLRIHQLRPMIDKWTDHFRKARARPVRLDGFDKAATEVLVWWREFLIDTKRINARDRHYI